MRFALASATIATLATAVLATSWQVQVGGVNGLNYNPQTVTAAVGDTVEFIFMAKNHTATQSTFAAPCEPMSGGIDSGFMVVAPNATQVPSMTITVNDTTPLWFFCRQTTHCEKGMVFAVNPTANKTYQAFQAAANASAPDGTPASATSSSGTGSGSAATASPSSSSSPNGAVAVGARAGSILAVVGIAAGVLL